MLGKYGETLVVDWGLAKAGGAADGWETSRLERAICPRSSEGSAPTVAGAAFGTPAFMSPEQAAGEQGRVGPWSDIYSLGATLSCLLTGQAPREGVPPRRIQGAVPAALEAVCAKAMASRPEDRYASARALAEEVEHWLADEPVSAWREPWRLRSWRWAKRHRTSVAAACAACAAVLVLSGVGLYTYQEQTKQETILARAALARAEQAREDARAAWSKRFDVSGWQRASDLSAAAMARDSRRLPAAVRRRLRAHAEDVNAEAARARDDAALLAELAEVRAGSRSVYGYDGPSAYRQVFDRHGLHVDTGGPETSTALPGHRPGPVAVQIASYLDDWAFLLQLSKGSRDRAARITAWADALDGDSRRASLRGALGLPDRSERRRALLRMAAEPDAVDQSPVTVTLLTTALRHAGETGAGIRILEAARYRHPEDPWVHEELGLALLQARPPRREDAMRALTAAAALRPETAELLAATLRNTGRTAEAVAVMEAMLRRRTSARELILLASMKRSLGRREESDELYRRAAELSRASLQKAPGDRDANHFLAMTLSQLGDHAGAIAAYRQVLRADPDSAILHDNLGLALRDAGDVRGAVAESREALRLEPENADFLNNLGVSLRELGDLSGAAAAFRGAIRARAGYAWAYANLGIVLRAQGDRAGAIVALREAIEHQPDLAAAHHNLGNALRESGDLPGAIVSYREAIRRQGDLMPAHANLGDALGLTGDFAGAVESFRRARDLTRPGSRESVLLAGLLQRAESQAALAARLPAIVRHEEQPTDTAEALAFADIAYAQKLFAAAVDLYARALASDPDSDSERTIAHRYNAACAAALAGCGKGRDEPPPGKADRARLRALALGWLEANLAAWSRRVDGLAPPARAELVQQIRHWRTDPDLAGVRDAPELAQLPESERLAWQAFWPKVEDLLGRVELRSSPPAAELPVHVFAK